MAQEKEGSFPIKAWKGIDRNVDPEDLSPQHLFSLENLWEPKIGTYETRPGSTAVHPSSAFPSNISKIMNANRIYKSEEEQVRIAAVQCTPSVTTGTMPSEITGEWVNDSNAYWKRNNANFPGTDWDTDHDVYLRLYGYGVDRTIQLSVSGSPVVTGNKLRITVASGLDENITGIEVYAECNISNYNDGGGSVPAQYMWAGNIDLSGTRTGTFDFDYSPYGVDSALVAAPGNYSAGSTAITYTVEHETTGGSLKANEKIYVLVAPQYINTAIGNSKRCLYRQTGVNPYALSEVTPPTDTTKIVISSISPTPLCCIVFAGYSPQTLVPVGIINDSATIDITSIPEHLPAVADFQWTAANTATYGFVFSDYSHHDMLIKVGDEAVDGIRPIFIGRQHQEYNWDQYCKPLVDAYVLRLQNDMPSVARPGEGSTFRFARWDNLSYFVTNYDLKLIDQYAESSDIISSTQTIAVVPSRSRTNYYVCDGRIAATVIHDRQDTGSGPEQFLPICYNIQVFKDQIIVGGGPRDSSGTIYNTRVVNPHDFTEAGASAPTLNFITIERGGEKLSGLGIYSNTTGDSGPFSSLIVGKKNSLWLTNDISSGSVNQLSGETGVSTQETIVRTPIGTIISSVDNVYLVRENGEPVPIGEQVKNIIKGADMTTAVACYHDEHYKLAFYHSDYAGTAGYNNVELWLNIDKMKKQNGEPDWVGPMHGRETRSYLNENLSGDGLTYNEARDLWVTDSENIRIYKASVLPGSSDTQVLDFATAVTSKFITKDYGISQEDENWNKLLKRTYWKCKTNTTSGTPLSATERTYIDGELAETQALSMYGLAATAFDNQPQKVFPYFPTGRLRGRTVRKELETTNRIGIGGFAINYQVERRRI